jgi:hypothetical protein
MKTAKLITDLTNKFNGEAQLYRVDPPMVTVEYGPDGETELKHEYVIVSAVVAFGKPETYIFPADEDGEIVSWSEMEGSFRGELDIPKALALAGYSIVSS